MERKRINAVLIVAALALTLLIPTALPLASTAARHLEQQPLESLTALNSTEATERGASLSAFSVPLAASVVQSPGTTTRISTALRSAPVMFIENVGQFDPSIGSGQDASADFQRRPLWLTANSATFNLMVVSDTSTEYLSEEGWRLAVLAWTYAGWPTLQDANWIWKSQLVTPEEAHDGTDVVTFRRKFSLPWDAQDIDGVIQITADNAYELSLNGIVIGHDGVLDPSGTDLSWNSIETYQFNAQPGENELVIMAINYKDALGRSDPYRNPAGVLFRAQVTGTSGGPTPFLDLPFDYGGSVSAFLQALKDSSAGGRVTAWFDHKYPDYSTADGIWLYNQEKAYTKDRTEPQAGIFCYAWNV